MLQVFHTEHGELEVVLSFTGDEGVNATGVVGPSMHFAHGGNVVVIEFDEAILVNESFHFNHAAGDHIFYAQTHKQAAKGFTGFWDFPG